MTIITRSQILKSNQPLSEEILLNERKGEGDDLSQSEPEESSTHESEIVRLIAAQDKSTQEMLALIRSIIDLMKTLCQTSENPTAANADQNSRRKGSNHSRFGNIAIEASTEGLCFFHKKFLHRAFKCLGRYCAMYQLIVQSPQTPTAQRATPESSQQGNA